MARISCWTTSITSYEFICYNCQYIDRWYLRFISNSPGWQDSSASIVVICFVLSPLSLSQSVLFLLQMKREYFQKFCSCVFYSFVVFVFIFFFLFLFFLLYTQNNDDLRFLTASFSKNERFFLFSHRDKWQWRYIFSFFYEKKTHKRKWLNTYYV